MRTTRWSCVAALALAAILAASCDGEVPEGPDLGGLPFGEEAAFRNPVLDIKQDEWAVYRLMDGKEMRWDVVKVQPQSRVATVVEETRDPKVDKLLESREIQFGLNHILAGFVSARHVLLSIYFDEITVAGRTWLALCVDTASGQTGRIRQWYSMDVPVIGLLRQEKVEPNSQRVTIMTELEDWSGRKKR